MNPDLDMIQRFLAAPEPQPMSTSPLLEAMEARLEAFDAKEQTLAMSFAPPTMFRQGAGVVQGGALSMMLDFVLAFAAMAELGGRRGVTTVSLATDFLGAAKGARIDAFGVVERAGRSMVFTRGWLMDEERKVAAAQSALMVLPG